VIFFHKFFIVVIICCTVAIDKWLLSKQHSLAIIKNSSKGLKKDKQYNIRLNKLHSIILKLENEKKDLLDYISNIKK